MIRQLQRHYQANGRHICFQLGAVVSVILLGLVSIGAQAQEDTETCPCFNSGEVESIFLRAEQLSAEEGESVCKAEDYSVELIAELAIWDIDYTVNAKVRVEWYDFDPGRCSYIDSIGNPGIERDVSWPHPAPEATARACYDILVSAIEKFDTSGKCFTTY